MKLYATIKNTRGGKKSTGDDTRILIEVSFKNKILGTLGLYTIENNPNGSDLGYRVVWSNELEPVGGRVLRQEETKGKQQKDECKCYRIGFHEGKGGDCECDCHSE